MTQTKTPVRRALTFFRGAPLLELALIIVGALLALALEDWADEREKTQRARTLLQLVVAEIETNYDRLTTEIDYHRNMRLPIQQSVVELRDNNRFALPEGWQGTRPIQLTRTAFELAVTSNALARLPAPTALEIADVYETMRRMEVTHNNNSLVTLQTDFTDGDRYLRLLSQTIDGEVRRSETLLPQLANASGSLTTELEQM
ncbi:MAG: hypothetical protein AAGJ86_02730 [Pseudomonadota bacterium]